MASRTLLPEPGQNVFKNLAPTGPMDWLNTAPHPDAQDALMRVCHSSVWVERMLGARPFATVNALCVQADTTWRSLSEEDWLEGFAGHPRIGDVDALRKKYAESAKPGWESGEQAGAAAASEEVLGALKEGNDAYEEKFGFIFLVCATGKNADEMLALLRRRLPNDRATELLVAVGEQSKITAIRLDKLLREHAALDAALDT